MGVYQRQYPSHREHRFSLTFLLTSTASTLYTAFIGAAGWAWCAELSEVHLQRMPE
jgi:hypothetical protein